MITPQLKLKILAKEKEKRNLPVGDAIGFIHSLGQLREHFTPKKGVDYLTDEELAEIKKQSMPIKGKDYFTDDELKQLVSYILKQATPIKGTHYFDGEKGKDGIDGKNGKSGLTGKDGKDGKDGKPGKDATIDIESLKEDFMEEVKKILKGRKYGVKDIEDLENRLNLLATKVEKNYGAHGGTTIASAYTTSDNTTFTLTTPLQISELQVYRGGARNFSENGDFTYTTVKGNPKHIATITLSSALDAGENLNIYGKQ